MESINEIQNMRVSELKEFLKRNGKDIATIERNDGKSGPPRKVDLLGAALKIRADYDNPVVDGPTSPQNKGNIFQSGYSPKSARNTPMSDGGEQLSTPLRSTRKPKRRSSVGWVNPAFLAKLTPKSSPVPVGTPTEKMTPGPEPESDAPNDVESYENDFGDEGDQIIQSDYDSTAGGSGVESDGGSVVETDEDEFSSVNQFKFMKAYEVRAWLTDHNVPFNHRSKKVELISLATAHALYLEAHAADDDKKVKEKVAPVAEETALDDEIQIVENPPPVPSLSLKQRRYRKERNGDHSDDERATSSIRSRKSRKSSKRRTIQAPPSEDTDVVMKEVAQEDEIVPAEQVKSRRKKKPSEMQTARPPPQRPRVEPRLALPKIRLPRIVLTMKGVLRFLIGLALVTFVALCVRWWQIANRPFCDTFASSTRLEDGRECRPCPSFGTCSRGELTCDKNYRREGRICVEDSAVNDYAVYLERSMVRLMTIRKGAFACDATVTHSFDDIQLRNMFEESNLTTCPKSRLEVLEKKKLDVRKFDSAFEKAIWRMRKNPKLKYWREEGRFEAVEGQKTLGCTLFLFCVKHFFRLLLGLIVTGFLLRWKLKRYLKKRHEARVEDIYRQACEILRDVKLNYSEDDKVGDAFMRDTELRMEILGRYSTKSGKLWSQAEELLKTDSRVSHSSRTIQGRPCYIYEWKGNLRRPSMGGLRQYGTDSERRRLSFGSRGYESASPRGFDDTITPRIGLTPRVSPRAIESTPRGSPREFGSGYSSGSPTERRMPPMTPNSSAPSPGYTRLLNLWRGR